MEIFSKFILFIWVAPVLLFLNSAHANGGNPQYKVAIIGDSGAKDAYKRVLELIKEHRADLVLHAGDLAYDEGNSDAPKKWNALVNESLGEKFPYFFVIGNHDLGHWFSKNAGYHELLKTRIKKSGLDCSSNYNNSLFLGIKNYCKFNDLLVVGSGVGTLGYAHEPYIKDALKENKNMPWKICLWHKNQRDMQPGTKIDEVGWGAYQACQKAGAMILTGHEHAYSRTYTLTDLGNKRKYHGMTGSPETIELGPNSTFVAVSGLGGRSAREFACSIHENDRWWASIVTSNYRTINNQDTYGPFCSDPKTNEEKYGALFITFNVDGDDKKAFAEFISTDNEVLDRFYINRQ